MYPIPKSNTVVIPKLPIGENKIGQYAQLSNNVDDQSMESYQFDSKDSEEEESYPDIIVMPSTPKENATAGGAKRTTSNSVTRPMTVPVPTTKSLNPKKQA